MSASNCEKSYFKGLANYLKLFRTLDNSFEIMNDSDMFDVNGGAYFSKNQVLGISATLVGFGAPLILLGMVGYKKFMLLTIAGIWKASSTLGVIFGAVGLVVGLLIGAVASTIASGFVNALIQGKGLKLGVKKTFFGMPYWISATPQ